jgi:signal transduction histidine kinase/CheY-like chemotaxis protein
MSFDNNRVLAEQIKLVMTEESRGLLFSPIIAILLYFFLSSRVEALPLTIWITSTLLISATLSAIQFYLLKTDRFAITFRFYFLIVCNVLVGILWGSLAWISISEASIFNSVVVISLLVSLLVSLMSTLSPVFILYVITASTIGGMSFAKLLLLNNSEFRDIGLFGFAATGTFIFMARNMSMHTKNTIFLKLDNQDLIKKLEIETSKVRTAQERAELESQAKTKFLAAASHDIRQPIHALGLFLDVFSRSDLSEYQKKVLRNANSAFDGCVEMLNTLLDFSKVDAGIVDAQVKPFHLQPLLNKLENEMAPLAENKNIFFRAKETSAVVLSDPNILELVLRNLLSNAIRYTESGGVLMACRQRTGHTSLEIWDTGIGIDPIHHENIFKEFYQLGNIERDRRKGLGLGLAIVRGYTSMLQHPLSFHSTPGRGSVFKLQLVNAVDEPIQECHATINEPPTQLNISVLIIDDDENVRTGMVALFQSWGCHCAAAETIEEAVTLALHTQPLIIISDYRLRNSETGAQAITAIRHACNKEIPALLITGDTAKDRLIEATNSGIPILNKPVSAISLHTKIVDLLQL